MSTKQVRIEVAIREFFESLEAERLSASTIRQKVVSLNALRRAVTADNVVYCRDLARHHFDVALTDLANGAGPEEIEQRRGHRGAPRRGRNPATVAVDRRNMKQFFEFCKENHWVAYNSHPLVRTTKSTRPKGDDHGAVVQRRIVPPEQWTKLLDIGDELHPRTRMLLALGLFSGRRVSEIALMQWKHIELSTQEIDVYNQKRGRWVHLSFEDMLASEFTRWQSWVTAYAAQCHEDLVGVINPEWYVVPPLVRTVELVSSGFSYRAHRDLRRDWPVRLSRQAEPIPLIKEVQRCLVTLGWDDAKQEGVHTLRRSMASHLDNLGKLQEAQALLDHKNLSTTEVYTGNRAGERRLRELMKENGGDPFQLREVPADDNVVWLKRRAQTS